MGWALRWPPRTMWLFMIQPRRWGWRLRSTRFFQSMRAENTAVLDIWPDTHRGSTWAAPRNLRISAASSSSQATMNLVP